MKDSLDVNGNQMKGSEFKSHVLNSLCSCRCFALQWACAGRHLQLCDARKKSSLLYWRNLCIGREIGQFGDRCPLSASLSAGTENIGVVASECTCTQTCWTSDEASWASVVLYLCMQSYVCDLMLLLVKPVSVVMSVCVCVCWCKVELAGRPACDVNDERHCSIQRWTQPRHS